MLGSLARRQRRPLWGWLVFLSIVAVSVSLFNVFRARDAAIVEAGVDAELTAQTELATLLEPRDLEGPVTDDRALEITAAVESQITSVSRIDEVRIYSSIGRILYADDPGIVGTRPSYLRELTFEVANGDPESHARGGMLQTFVPIWLAPDGVVVVAEMSQPLDPITSTAYGPWIMVALFSGVVLLGAIAMIVVTSIERTSASAPMVYDYGPSPRRQPGGRPTHGGPPQRGGPSQPGGPPQAVIPGQPGVRELEQMRQAAEGRARASEQDLKGVRAQLKEALGQISLLEAQIEAPSVGQQECEGLRERFRETSERLNLIEMDNTALRERLHLREQELEEARGRIRSAETAPRGMAELRRRLEGAEERATDMAREMKRIETELDDTTTRLHMSKLTEALREIDGEEPGHVAPVVVEQGSESTSPEKVR